MKPEAERDWFKTGVHFFCGFVVAGLATFFYVGDWLPALVVGLVAGGIAGFWLDDFWERCGQWFT